MSDDKALDELKDICRQTAARFTTLLDAHLKDGITKAVYQRYLSMEYHLTRDVQRYFMTVAAHHAFARLRKLRAFLVRFAGEEELHYVVAANDLRALGLDIVAAPFDVDLWHAYFRAEMVVRPFARLGAACVLENLANPDNRGMLKALLTQARFLDAHNTKFLVLHMHEVLPHGEQMLAALAAETLSDEQLRDLADGARKGAVMYLRMVEWALDACSLAAWPDKAQAHVLEREEAERIAGFRMEDLQLAPADAAPVS
jgi:hypothetical protein